MTVDRIGTAVHQTLLMRSGDVICIMLVLGMRLREGGEGDGGDGGMC